MVLFKSVADSNKGRLVVVMCCRRPVGCTFGWLLVGDWRVAVSSGALGQGSAAITLTVAERGMCL